ncbi:hypothetical protein HPB48_009959 [Haemaphysalis longicornis]|uniref:Mutator-like transposase domain-containing protein n=1 Tax=Haemaphysalis longicornis TaxID=44386 RepID=A0A9J6GV90_HAELO|nr:hypothetical protein HPB48_009959 [Haemaphysalis longicornis]
MGRKEEVPMETVEITRDPERNADADGAADAPDSEIGLAAPTGPPGPSQRVRLDTAMLQPPDVATGPVDTNFLIASLDSLNSLMNGVKCKTCGGNVSVSTGEREYGLAVKLCLECVNCGVVSSSWSSPRVEGEQKVNPFVVNVLAARAMQSSGNRQAALNDVFAEMNISHRGLHTKTWQHYVKTKLTPAATRAADSVTTERPWREKGRLTGELITKLSRYYGWALKSHKGNVEETQKAVMATYHHPLPYWPGFVVPPKCCYCKGRAHAETPLQLATSRVQSFPRPVYERLSDRKLLERCQRGQTQNNNESLHAVIWALAPKERHASLFTVEAAVAEAVMRFNGGNERTSAGILKKLNLTPGQKSAR